MTKFVSVRTTNGETVEINPDAIAEIEVEEEEDPGFLGIFGAHEGRYHVYMRDGHDYYIDGTGHDKLQKER
ncbi:MAG: hypothetical protein HXY43_23580 [Fischerella sp.]|jgi:hypothetical protein|uniref:hypothetical protein n=1 Tax=Fischerella sp. TaxID=1191 RepID=UPI0017E788F9|nr:hypothetical protein [Fischerella sp.]NWF62154.1 hypothetical protein [Fischerella sp.]